MHLFAAKPGGYVDDEGIIDLNQTPGDLVILSAADSSLSSLAQAAERLEPGFPSLRLANWMHLVKPAAFDLYQDRVLDHAKVVVVSLLGGVSYWEYGFDRLVDWASRQPNRHLLIVPGDDTPDDALFGASNVPLDSVWRVWRYLREGGRDNSAQLLRYLANGWLGLELTWREPRPLPACMLYRPSASSGQVESTFAEWQSTQPEGAPVCVLVFYRSHLQSGNTALFDSLIEVLESKGLAPLPLAVTSLKDSESQAFVNHLIDQSGAVLVVNTTGFAINRQSTTDLDSDALHAESVLVDAAFSGSPPVLQWILASQTEDDWAGAKAGLRGRDLAMQVVLPEMDGRIITRAIAFKSESHYSDRCQVSVVRHRLHPERADFVAELAYRFCRLKVKPNRDKRLALILANYPTKDGRIGNGVGLDTPASTLNILKALQQAGYPVRDIPSDGDALITELMGAVTNNPNTLHLRPCWQSLAVSDYLDWFNRLPSACREAVLQQWGPPERDPKYRNGRLMLAGIRLGDTFVGIQPARGFDRDPAANYHDPDLVPPHSYLAFYAWLRLEYRVDAIVHVGKHGNLEWLPGKGTALSADCWPDIALGPMPHFYPFIVNDPGEGSQAKRRAQAVIIDHLMPPMTRAETYGELTELENRVDEYYQALGLDAGREAWLREAIIQQLKETGIGRELSGVADIDTADDDTLLNELDTYLCDIKEAQIRHGLHILGALPARNKLADTLVALLRLPRGRTPEHQGILHNLAEDLGLFIEGELFNPLAAEATPWQGPRPDILAGLSESSWRTEADSRERLEWLAQRLVADWVLDDKAAGYAPEAFPRTHQQCQFVRKTLWQALQRSAEWEIQSLIDGLGGRFVPPGPSGAPTRGRLDVLPTGRNFYSVDSRSIPSPAAWAIGEKSAQALIERHLQEEGDYPRRLGLSVWGTATMRTGGDDIAQAFALMGVRPIRAEGSQRVVDIEVVPTMLLGRPRVDVTLRISGFFRDAFPNVIRLFDAAVQAIAESEEPGLDNTIREQVRHRQAALMDEGMSPEAAFRQASYRVFGSKPGAYGAGLQGLIDERCWETGADLADAYLNWGGYAYGQMSGDGVAARDAFAYQLSGLEAVVQNQDNREHDLLDSDDYYQFQGGMTNAVRELSGRMPAVYHGDHANPAAPRIRTLKEELNRVIRSRALNPKWIQAMREHGYKGAFEMAATVDYLFAYDATTDLVDDHQYRQLTDALVFDEANQRFLREHNRSALEEMAERLLEATQRGLWRQPDGHEEKLQDLLLELDEEQERSGR